MTVEEHVDNICNWKHNAGLRNAVLEEMRDLVEECAKIADGMIGARRREIAEEIRKLSDYREVAEVVPFKKVG